MKRARWILFVSLSALFLQGCADKAPLGHEKFLYSAVGTSDVLGLGAFPLANGYTFRIQNELRAQGRNVALFQIAIPAANTDIISNAVRTAAENGLRAEFATVWVGANDLIDGVPVDSFASELNVLLTLLQDSIGAYVIIANVPSLPKLPEFVAEPLPEVTEQRVARFNGVIDAQAAVRGIPVIDLVDDAIDEHLVIDFDGVHPDDEGHERLARLFMNVIRPQL